MTTPTNRDLRPITEEGYDALDLVRHICET